MAPHISVVIPALNEATCIGATLDAVQAAFAALPPDRAVVAEFLVVDNGSDDATADVARAHGARVVPEPVRGVARARNAGARSASGAVLFFLDADTLVPPAAAARLLTCVVDPACLGGAFDTDQRPARLVLRAYLAAWRVLGRVAGMAQGAAQFCRQETFVALGGYDERLFMGEDVDFYWRLKRLARKRSGHVVYVRDVRVVPSARRFDHWPVWKVLFWTDPLIAALLRHRKTAWRGWSEAAPR